MSGLSSVADAVHLEPPTLKNICIKIAFKVRQLEKRLHRSNSAVRRQIAFKFHKISRFSREDAELSKHTLGRIQDGRRRPNF